MKILTNVVTIAAIIGLLSTLICGFWMKSQPSIETSSIGFHTTLGTLSVVLSVVAMILLLVRQS